MTTQQTPSTNAIIRNVEFFWARLDKPVSPFGEDIYSLRIEAPKAREAELSAFGKVKVVKDNANKVYVELKKKAFKADGSEAAKVLVVDAAKQPLDPKLIGNGSIGNVLVMQRPYEIKAPNGRVTKSGTVTMLSKVQVTSLVKYEPKASGDFVDFDDEVGNVSTAVPEDADF